MSYKSIDHKLLKWANQKQDKKINKLPIKPMKGRISPLKGKLTVDSPWEGDCSPKPWEYEITAVIPTLDTFDTLELAVKILDLQTIKPYIIIIDTGSCDEELDKIEQLRNESLEVHILKLNGTRHPSDYPAIAMDLAFSLCRTPFLFATHADCFLRKRNFLEELLLLCKNKSPAVGYRLSPRPHKDWEFMVSHTASMYHMATMDKIGFGWSLRRLCNIFDIKDMKPNPETPNWPDTEILGNYILKKNNIKPLLIGDEGNFCRNLDENIDHVRTYTSAKLYSPPHLAKLRDWLISAKSEAEKRILEWKQSPIPIKIHT